jgi:threonine dehydrogenase-like Zn-dependent dehydrogenase
MPTIAELVANGDIGGRTAEIVEGGSVVCEIHEPASVAAGAVRVRTAVSVISPGTEMTFYGPNATNVYLNKSWNPDLRLFEVGARTLEYPVTFGYRAAGVVVESRSSVAPVGLRVYGNWRHTEFVQMPGERAVRQALPDELSFADGADIGQMAPICVNAAAFGEGAERDHPAVVYGAGPVGLITAQVIRANGASAVHVVDRNSARLGLASELGFDTIQAGPDVARTLKTQLGSEAIPVAWECTGSTFGLQDAIRVVRRQGLVVAVGFYQGEAHGLFLGDEFHHNGVRIVSGQIGNIHSGLTMDGLRARSLELALAGQVRLGALERIVVPIDDVAEAFAMVSEQNVLQVALSY